MAIKTAQGRENLAVSYGNAALYGALYTTSPGTAAGAEPTGGSPAYVRKSLAWSNGTVDGVISVTVTFDVPSGVTIVGAGIHSGITGGYLDGAAFATQEVFSAQETLQVTFTFTQA